MSDTFKNSALSAVVALVFGFLGAAVWSWSGLADARTRTYLLDNPQILPLMAEAYQRDEATQRLAGIADEVMKPFPGAVLGNPQGSKVLVEFTDYNCPYCRLSKDDITKLVAEDPEVKVVIREWPIFQGSDIASRMALAAAKQDKYQAFHEAMFEMGPATPETVLAAAEAAGLDLEQAQIDGVSEEVELELAQNLGLARQLGFTGTPSWVTRESAFEGAVGFEALKQAVNPGDS